MVALLGNHVERQLRQFERTGRALFKGGGYLFVEACIRTPLPPTTESATTPKDFS